MKKLILLFGLVVSCIFSLAARGQMCTISGSNDTIMVIDDSLSDSTVTVTVSNDSNDTSANVVVEICVTYKDRTQKTFNGYGLVKPNAATGIQIPIETKNKKNWEMSGYSVVKVSGTKCN